MGELESNRRLARYIERGSTGTPSNGSRGGFSLASPPGGHRHHPLPAKVLAKQNDDNYLTEVESERLVDAYIKFKSRYIPDIDYRKPETFAHFGLAEKYYEDTIKGIYGSYPYDGSKAEKMEWSLSASFLDLYFIEHEYPKAKGYISFDHANAGSVSAVGGSVYPNPSSPQYISFTGGPHINTVYDAPNNRESNLKINGLNGNTIEFWLKKDAGSWFTGASTQREVVFDIHTDDHAAGTANHGRVRIDLENPASSGDSPILFTYLSGAIGATALRLGSSAVTKASLADGKWHHYAVSTLSSDSATTYKLYVDGVLDYTISPGHSVGPVDRPVIGTIGAMAVAGEGSTGGVLGRGRLSGSLDEVRFWKEERSEKQIGRFWYNPVHGGTDNDRTSGNLGLYYKFNEGPTGIELHDKTVLDYSGRVGNGTIINWSSGMNISGSAVDSSENLPESNFIEIGDPIINPDNQLVVNAMSTYKNHGKHHDSNNMASLVNSVPNFLSDSDDRGLFIELLQIMASSFDDIFLKIKNLPKMKDFAYQEFFKESGKYRNSLSNNFLLGCEDTYSIEFTGDYTKPWVNHILQNYGMVTTEVFPDTTLFETFFNRSEQLRFEHNLVEVKNTILSNIHKNLVHIYKSKGTERAFRNLIRCFGVDQELIRMNAYGKREAFKVETRPVYGTLKQKTINFEGQNYQGSVYLSSSAADTTSLHYIAAESTKKPLSVTSNFLFPIKTDSTRSTVNKVSLFGAHSVAANAGSTESLTWHASDKTSFQVYFNKRALDSKDGYFELTSSAGNFTAMTSPVIPAVYDNSHWSLTVRVGTRSDTEFTTVGPSSGNQYFVEFIGHEYETDVLKNTFHLSSSISAANYDTLSKQNKALYLGSHKTNFSGSHLESSDVRSFGLTAWRDAVSDEEIKEYAQNPAFYGRIDPLKITKHDNGENLKRGDALVLRWQFENLKNSDSSNQMVITDYSGQAGPGIANKNYHGLAVDMVNSGSAIAQEFLPVVEYNPIDNLHTSDRIKIKTQEISKFEADSRPVTYFYNFEKSMYQVVSAEMINMFAGLTGYNNIVGENVNKYRIDYKALEKLREKFFRKVNTDIDLDKFVEYYRWIDYSLSNFLNQLVPATSNFGNKLKNVVESHILERNKYQHKPPTIRITDENISASAVSVGNAGYAWTLPTDWHENQVSSSIDFTGGASAVVVADADDLTHSNSPDAPFAISFWFDLVNTGSGTQTLLTKPSEYTVQVKDDDIEFTLFTNGSNHTKIVAANQIDTEWTNVIVTYDGTLDLTASVTPRKIYINGAAATTSTGSTGTYSGMNGSANNLIIGADDASGTNNFNGQIADVVMITGSELSAAQALEFYAGGRSFDVATHSRYADVLAWWKMGDDQDLASGSGAVQDYVGTHEGTPSNITIETQTTVFRHRRDIETTDPRYSLHQIIKKDLANSLEATRLRSKPYKISTGEDNPIHTGINKLSHNPLISVVKVNKGNTIILSKDSISELEGKYDTELPFTFTSASDGVLNGSMSRNYPITNNHIDFESSREESLKGPFADAHVGGMPHRSVPFRTADAERPEAYTLVVNSNEVTMSATPINKPKSMFLKDVTGTRFMNLSNIKHNSVTGLLGNYSKNYEVVLTSGRRANNKHFLRTTGSWLKQAALSSAHISGVVDFEVPARARTEHVITSRFTALGGPETTALTRDRETEEMSVYNSMNYRNLVVRSAQDIISREHSEQFGYRSGSTTNASRHKINRNPLRYNLSSSKEVRYDNEIIQHPIPQTDYQYSWVTASTNDDVYDFLSRNNNRAHTSNFRLSRTEYNSDFSDDTTGTIPSGWKTNASFLTSSYVTVKDTGTFFADSSGNKTANRLNGVAATAGLVAVDNVIYRSSSSGYNKEFTFSAGSNTYNQYHIGKISSNGQLAAFKNAQETDIYMYRSSSAGWALDQRLTGAVGYAASSHTNKSFFFSGSTLIYVNSTGSGNAQVNEYLTIFSSGSGTGWQPTTSSAAPSNINLKVAPSFFNGNEAVYMLTYPSKLAFFKYTTSWQFVTAATVSKTPFGDYPNALSFNGLANAIACDGTNLWLGADRNSGQLTRWNSGASGWNRTADANDRVFSPDQDFADNFGKSMAVSGSFLAVGSPGYDITFGQEQRVNADNDKGAVYLYQISGSDLLLQRSFYNSKENPEDLMNFGTSLGFDEDKLIIESTNAPVVGTESSSRIDTVQVSSGTSPVDRSLLGPIVSGSNLGLVLKGEIYFASEVYQLPVEFSSFTGNKFRIVETIAAPTSQQPEFKIEISVMQGSDSASDISKTTHKLTKTPSVDEFLIVQHKIGTGTWQNSDILIPGVGTTGNTEQNSFVSYASKVIENYDLDDVHIRIISNVDDQESIMWAVEKVMLKNTPNSLNSSAQLIKTTSFRKNTVRQVTEDIDGIFFSNPSLHMLGRMTGSLPTGSSGLSNGAHTNVFSYATGSNDRARTTSLWLQPLSGTMAAAGAQVFSYAKELSSATATAASYALQLLPGSDETKFKVRFSLGSDTSSEYIQSKYYRATTTNSFSYGKWIHVAVTYDGLEGANADSIKIYINGTKQDSLHEINDYEGQPAHIASTMTGRSLFFGSEQSDNNYSGHMTNFVLFGKQLSDVEVQEIYDLKDNLSETSRLSSDQFKFTKASTYSDALAWWTFDKTSSSQLTYTDTYAGDNNYIFTVHTDAISNYTVWAGSKNASDKMYAIVSPPPDNISQSRNSPDFSTTKIGGVNSTAELYLLENNTTMSDNDNSRYLENTLSPHSYPTWVQLRQGDAPIARKQKKENKLTISVRGNETFPSTINRYNHDLNADLVTTPDSTSVSDERTVEVYDEVMLSSRYNPIVITGDSSPIIIASDYDPENPREITQERFRDYWNHDISFNKLYSLDAQSQDTRVAIIKTTHGNDLSMFSNEELNDRLIIDEYKEHNTNRIVSRTAALARAQNINIYISYKETLYPKEVNTFTRQARTRENFDFFSWRDERSDRVLTLTGSNEYSGAIVNVGNTKVFPEIVIDKFNHSNSNEHFVDSTNIKERMTVSPTTTNIKTSRWPLDARTTFASPPSELRKSYYNQGDMSLIEADVGTKGEGVLQNDYNIFGLGYNGLHGTPPASSLYSRRIPQTYGSSEYLAGEAKWQAADQSGRKPYENEDDTREKLKRQWQDHSLVPEYKVSEYVEDIILNNRSDFSKVREKQDYLSVTGAVYHTSSQEISVGSKFFKTYGTSEFMKYFGANLEQVKDNGIGGALKLTLKCNAAIKFTPYRGFYPVERTLQIGELFSRGYMSDFAIVDERQTAADRLQVTSPEKLIERKIRANIQQTLKPLMAPGILYNSIKAGMAVDYPIFGTSADETALGTFNTNIQNRVEPFTAFDSSLNSLKVFTGSAINNTSDTGIPRISGSAQKRITFEELLEPQKLIGTKIFDNEPHESASIYYGDQAITKVFDYPFQFGKLDANNNERKAFASGFSLNKTLDDTLTPYKMALNNFCAETVSFFLEDGKLASLESDQVNPSLVKDSVYKMRVYIKNNSLTMYDRHSAFGPPVDEGSVMIRQITSSNASNPGISAHANLGAPFITIASANIGSGTTNFVLQDAGGDKVKINFISGSTGSNITTGTFGPSGGTSYDVSTYGNVYVSGVTSSIDLASIESSGQDTGIAINNLMRVAINHHRWSGALDIEANFVDNNLRLRQIATGSSGNTAITTTGSMSLLYPSIASAFVSGANDTTDTTSITNALVTSSNSHEFAPFTPPYLDRGSEPYVEISYTAPRDGVHSLDEILEGATHQYVNFKDVPSNATTNTNYKNAMSISASLDLSNFVAYVEEGQSDPGTTLEQRKKWIIQTKWETPILNFASVAVDALDLSSSSVSSVTGSPWQTRTWNQYLTKSSLAAAEPLLTGSTGMWHQYGSLLNSNEGYSVSIEKIEGVADDKQLARKVGFLGEDMKPVSATPGKIAEKKQISEAVVAIPFYINKSGDRTKFFSIKQRMLGKSVKLNKQLEKDFKESTTGVSRKSEAYNDEKERYLNTYNNPGTTGVESIAYQLRMMQKFVFPPQFDYFTYPGLSQKPMMYVFQFNAELTQQDLANIWQNLSPSSVKSGASPRGSSVDNLNINGVNQDIQYVSNYLTKAGSPWLQNKDFLNQEVRWLIFKVKQRAHTDLAKVKIGSLPGVQNNLKIDNARTSIKPAGYLEDKKYSYNWPYDYFSLVELIKVEAKVDYGSTGDDGET